MYLVASTASNLSRTIVHLSEDQENTLCGRQIPPDSADWFFVVDASAKGNIACQACRRADEASRAPAVKKTKRRTYMHNGHPVYEEE